MYKESISTNNLTIGYTAHNSKFTAADDTIIQSDLTFALNEGELVCMLGPNGSGKSTLLRTLAGLQTPLNGHYTIHSAHARKAAQVALVLTEKLSMDNTTVFDIVALGRYPYTSFLDGLTQQDRTIIEQSLQQVGFAPESIATLAQTPFNAHSDGEKQRILIAKALAQQTPIILLDEPTAHLDLPHRILILQLLRSLAHEQKKTILISTHELELALAVSDRILLMYPNQRGIQLDTATTLRTTGAFTEAFGMDVFKPLE